jgi:hypothetical protein
VSFENATPALDFVVDEEIIGDVDSSVDFDAISAARELRFEEADVERDETRFAVVAESEVELRSVPSSVLLRVSFPFCRQLPTSRLSVRGKA